MENIINKLTDISHRLDMLDDNIKHQFLEENGSVVKTLNSMTELLNNKFNEKIPNQEKIEDSILVEKLRIRIISKLLFKKYWLISQSVHKLNTNELIALENNILCNDAGSTDIDHNTLQVEKHHAPSNISDIHI